MADKVVPILLQTLKPIKIIKWKVNEGNSVSIGCVFLHYEVDEDDKHVVCKLKSTQAGTVHKLLAQEGDVVKPGAQLFELQACAHPTVMRDMCAECGADLRKDDAVTVASVPMVHSVPELKVSLEQAQKIGKADVDRLLKDRKLVLLVDLDQTLIHTTNDNIPANIKDVYHFQLYGPQSPWYHTRLRPGTHRFLENMSPYFELHICTFGARNYAHMIAMFLDQEGKLFSQRILSRDECFDPTSKTANLKALFPCGDDMVCIIDDREDVWSHAANLIHVKPYHFFQHTGDINAPPGLDKHESDEKEGVDLSKLNCDKQKKIKANGLLDKENKTKENYETENTSEENKDMGNKIEESNAAENITEKKNDSEKNIEENNDAENKAVGEIINVEVEITEKYIFQKENNKEKVENVKNEEISKLAPKEVVEEKFKSADENKENQSFEKSKDVETDEGKSKENTTKNEKGMKNEINIETDKENTEEERMENDVDTKRDKKNNEEIIKNDEDIKTDMENTEEERMDTKTDKENNEEKINNVNIKTDTKNTEEERMDTKTNKENDEEEIKNDIDIQTDTENTEEERMDTKTYKENQEEEIKNDVDIKTNTENTEEERMDTKTDKENNDEEIKNNVDIKIDTKNAEEERMDIKTEKENNEEEFKNDVATKTKENTSKGVKSDVTTKTNTEILEEDGIKDDVNTKIESESIEEYKGDKTNVQNNFISYSNNEKDNESKEDELIEIEDTDDYLMYLEDILKIIHKTFYEKFDKLEAGTVPDLKKVIPEVRRNVLKGTKLVFSGLVPTHIKLEQSKAYQVAKSLGATVTQDLAETSTHLVAVRPGTAKVNAGRRKKNLKIVTPDWLWACAERWTKVDEKLYTLSNKGSKNRHPPPHCSSPEHNVNFDDIQNTTLRKRTPSGRFMDTINPLMSFSSADIADMDREVEDIFNESESDGESSKKPTDIDEAILQKLKKDKESDDESSSSDESLTGEHPHGWRPNENSRKRSREEQDLDDESTADEFPSTKFRRGEQLSSDLDIGQDSNSEGSVDAPDEIDDGDWNMMGAALEREFLANN